MTQEIRTFQLRAAERDGKPVIEGTSIVFDQPSVDLGGFIEVIERGAVEFDDDVVADFDHQTQYILGRQSNDTLEFRVDDSGVHFTATPPDTQWARDLLVSMREGYVSQCSFMFRCLEDTWESRGGQIIRRVKRALVSALSVVSMPAYPQTSAEARSRAQELREDVPEVTGDTAPTMRDEAEAGAAEASSDTGGAPEDKAEVFIPGIGFKTAKE